MVGKPASKTLGQIGASTVIVMVFPRRSALNCFHHEVLVARPRGTRVVDYLCCGVGTWLVLVPSVRPAARSRSSVRPAARSAKCCPPHVAGRKWATLLTSGDTI